MNDFHAFPIKKNLKKKTFAYLPTLKNIEMFLFYLIRDKVSCSKTLHSVSRESQTHDPSTSSLTLYQLSHCPAQSDLGSLCLLQW